MNICAPLQLSALRHHWLGAVLPSGCDAAVHAMQEIFEEEETDVLLLVHTSNAFNLLNRQVLYNIRHICPAMANGNIREELWRLTIMVIQHGGNKTLSAEGTTQQDHFAMPAYPMGIVPLLSLIRQS